VRAKHAPTTTKPLSGWVLIACFEYLFGFTQA
jgi:hypothetical protein